MIVGVSWCNISVRRKKESYCHVTQQLYICCLLPFAPISSKTTECVATRHFCLFRHKDLILQSVLWLLRLLLSYICVSKSLITSRWTGRLRSPGALPWAGVWVSFQSQTDRGHGGRHLRQVVGAQVSLKFTTKSKKMGPFSSTVRQLPQCSSYCEASCGLTWAHLSPRRGETTGATKAEHRAGRESHSAAAAFQRQRFQWPGRLHFTLPLFSPPPLPWPRSHWPVLRIKRLIPGGSWLILSSV